MSVEVIHFGCRLNAAEGERMEQVLSRAGMKNTIIFNGCSVTEAAESKLKRSIRRKRREHPDARLILTGCPATSRREVYTAMQELDEVVDNIDKLAWADRVAQRLKASLPASVPQTNTLKSRRTRFFLPIQNGCDHACTFCIIPQGRGPSRSVPIAELSEQIYQHPEAREVVLTGVDITAYGKDGEVGIDLGQLVKGLIDRHPGVARWRLSSLDSAEIDDVLLDLFQHEPRLMPHLHLSLQSGADLILKRMRRRHLRSDVLTLVHNLRERRPDIVFGGDIIAGFPTESEDHFLETCALLDEAVIDWLHVFPYSPRPGTPASRMPPVPNHIITQRARRLRLLARDRGDKRAKSFVGDDLEVLFETGGRGYTPHYVPVMATSDTKPETGSIHKVRLVRWNTDQQVMEVRINA